MRKKALAAILTICMAVTMFPAFAFAASEGSPSKDAPVKVSENSSENKAGNKQEATPALESIAPDVNIPDNKASRKATTASSTPVASVNGTEYYTVQEAIDAAKSGDVVTMLADAEEAVNIETHITLDMNGCSLTTYDAVDVITVRVQNVNIKDGYVFNLNYYPTDLSTGIFITSEGSATVTNVAATTVGGTATDNESAAFYVYEGGFGEFINCSVFYSEDLVTENDYTMGAFLMEDSEATFTDCSFEVLYGDCIYAEAEYSVFENCYFVTNSDSSSAFWVGPDAGLIQIHSGYYFGDPAIWIDYDWTNSMLILEGEFHSLYKGYSAISGNTEYVDPYGFNGQNTIASPSNWKKTGTADHIYFYEGASAPSSVKATLTSANGATAGYDDIKFTWGKSYQTDYYSDSGKASADGYKVTYKKGSGSYVNAKVYKSTASRARTVANLSDGYKYTFKVTPYILINEDLIEGGGTKCYSNKYKTAYTYTLKKVTLNTFSKSNGKVKVAWKNISGETGYQISRSTKKTGTNIVSTYKTTSGKSKLVSATKGKYYYYKVRAYKTIGKTSSGKDIRVYGPWSTPKKYKR